MDKLNQYIMPEKGWARYLVLFLVLMSGMQIAAATTTIDNASTNGWTTSNVGFNSSRLTDNGQLAIHLRNDSALNMSKLEAYWSFDENTGTTAHQVNTESGLFNDTNNGTLISMSPGLNNCTGACSGWNTSGRLGNGLVFDGTNDYVDVGNTQSINVTNITVSAWIKTTDTKAIQFIAGHGTTGSFGWYLGVSNGITVNFNIGNGTGSRLASNATNTYFNGNLTHVVGTYNGSYIVLYINGTPGTPIAQTGLINYTGMGSMYIGNLTVAGGAGDRNFHGTIDEVYIWNRSLNASEVAILYNTSMRTQGNVTITQQDAGNPRYTINRARLLVPNTQRTNNTVDLYSKPTLNSSWILVASNITNSTWYEIPSTAQSQFQDFFVVMNGNGSSTPYLINLEWDSLLSVISTSCNSVSSDINIAFGLLGALLIISATSMIIYGLTRQSFIIVTIGISTIIVGAIMVLVGYFIIITTSNGLGC